MTDIKLQKQIADYASDLKMRYGERDAMFDEMEDIFLCEWDEESQVSDVYENTRITISPDARNQALGAIRLLTASDPEFSMPVNENEVGSEISEDVEKWCSIVWDAAGRISGDPIHYDIVRSGVLFSEINIGVTSTKDMLAATRGNESKGSQRRIEQIAKVTPYIFEVYDPRTCYPDYDALGMRAFYREYDTLVRNIRDQFGDEAIAGIKEKQVTDYDTVTVCDFWDSVYRQVWIKGEQDCLIQDEHGLSFIPRVSQIVEGTRLFEEEEDQRQPFLYTLWKTGLWKRANLALTVMWTNIFAIGANPLFIHEQGTADAMVDYDFDVPGGIARVPPGSKFGPMLNKGVIDPSLQYGIEMNDKLVTESTIFKQTLGEPLGSNAPFSMVALLAQNGRLPLVTTQRKASWAIADAMKIALMWMKEEKGNKKVSYAGKTAELDYSALPENFELEAKLDIALPQDKLQQANIIGLLVGGDSPVMSKRWGRETLLNEGQSEAMQKEIWSEQAADLMFQMYAQELLQKQQMAQQMQMQQMAQQMQGPPPEQEQQMRQPPPGQGIPPEMMQGGAQPPQQPPGEPPMPRGDMNYG